MTRNSLRRTLTHLYVFLGVVLAVSLLSKLSDHVPLLKLLGIEHALKDIYELLRDMSLLIATAGVAYISNVYQKRSIFVTSLETEWRALVATKNTLYAFCEKPQPTADHYIDAFCRLSASIDNMRIVYRNVGETDELIGLYPYAPLHDMRRTLLTLDPRNNNEIPPEYRKLARDAILQSFSALRETFLDELDLEQPGHPLLSMGGRRLKSTGATSAAKRLQERQRQLQERSPNSRRQDVDKLLAELHAREERGGG